MQHFPLYFLRIFVRLEFYGLYFALHLLYFLHSLCFLYIFSTTPKDLIIYLNFINLFDDIFRFFCAVIVHQSNFVMLERLTWFDGVMVCTQDSQSCDPTSNLGGAYQITKAICHVEVHEWFCHIHRNILAFE